VQKTKNCEELKERDFYEISDRNFFLI